MNKLLMAIFISMSIFTIAVGCLILVFLTDYQSNSTHIYLVQEGFIGEVEVTFGQADAAPLTVIDGDYEYVIPESGQLKTSNRMKAGIFEVYYVSEQGERRRMDSQEQFIHGGGTKSHEIYYGDGRVYKSPTVFSFFVGSEEQWKEHLKTVAA